MITLSAVVHGFDPRAGQTKDYKLVFAATQSMKYVGWKAKTHWVCLNESTFLFVWAWSA